MNDAEKIQVLKVGLHAALNWLYQGESMKKHIADHVPLGESYSEQYISDINAIRQAIAVE